MFIVSEELAAQLVSMEDAINAVEAAFAAEDRAQARSFPVVRESLDDSGCVFGIKSGFDSDSPLLGLKAGGYWPGNSARSLTNHQSTVLLFDSETGRARALVSGNYLTGLRTGAACALAVKYLARNDASTLGIIGAGAQARHQVHAVSLVRDLKRVLCWTRSAERRDQFRKEVEGLGIPFDTGDPESVVREAEILVTITPSKSSLVDSDWVRPGTHISAMGADTAGKQELAADIIARSSVFVDSVQQAITIGECQAACRQGRFSQDAIRGTLGGLITGRIRGRIDDDEITVFDGTGIALQDLCVAEVAVENGRNRGLLCELPY